MATIDREPTPDPWSEGEKIPWHDPGFSERMLREHLSQSHDAASRRTQKIERHVSWIHSEVLEGASSKVLDLVCGPGLYSSRLADLGHRCIGIDFSPASIEYARAQAKGRAADCRYVLEDIRSAVYGCGFDLVMLIFGELNVFTQRDARNILRKAYAALTSGGALLLEVHTYAAVKDIGQSGTKWYTADRGVFSDKPYLCLQESFWHSDAAAATERYFVFDGETGEVSRYASTMQAYTEEEYRSLLSACGFRAIEILPSMTHEGRDSQEGLFAIVAKKMG